MILTRQQVLAALIPLGFTDVLNVRKNRSGVPAFVRKIEKNYRRMTPATDAPGHRPERGIYCLVSAHNRFYIGQAENVVRRFAQHLETEKGTDLVYFAFTQCPKDRLDRLEADIIREALAAGLPIVNKQHYSQHFSASHRAKVGLEENVAAQSIAVRTRFSQMVPEDEQQAFLARDLTGDWMRLEAHVSAAEREGWRHLLAQPGAEEILHAGRRFAAEALITPGKTAGFWQAEIPGPTRSVNKPLLVIYAGAATALNIFRVKTSNAFYGASPLYFETRLNTAFLASMLSSPDWPEELQTLYPCYRFVYEGKRGWSDTEGARFRAAQSERNRRAIATIRSEGCEYHLGVEKKVRRRITGADTTLLGNTLTLSAPLCALDAVLGTDLFVRAIRIELVAQMAQNPSILQRRNRLLERWLAG